MKTKLLRTACCCLLLLLTTTAYCQQPTSPQPPPKEGEIGSLPFGEGWGGVEVSMYTTLGAAAMSGNVSAGSLRPAAVAAGVGADVSWYFTRHWGLGAGVEAAFPNLQLSSAGITPSLNAASSLHTYTTRIDATSLRIPLLLCFRAPVWRQWFYVAAGASLDLALTGRYRTETTVRTGNSIQTEVTTGMLSLGHGVSLAAEAGFRWTLDSEWGIYTGAYAAYGLSDICPSGIDALSDVTRLNLLLVGLKVKITLHQ